MITENISLTNKPYDKSKVVLVCKNIVVLFLISLVLTSCTASKKTLTKNKTGITKKEEIVRAKNKSETKGNSINGYTLQNDNRIFFNALRALATNNFDTAYILLNYYKTLDSNNAAVYYQLAALNARANLPQQTLKYAKKAAVLNPKNKWIQSYYANILSFFEKYEEAAQIYSKLGSENPADRPEYLSNAAQLFEKANQFDNAIAALDTIEKYSAQNDEDVLLQKQQLYLRHEDFDKAIAINEQLINAYPLEPKYLVILSSIYDAKGDKKKSETYIQELEKKFPYNEDVSAYAFGYYLKKRNPEMVSQKLREYVIAAEKNKENNLTILGQIATYLADNPDDTTVLPFVTDVTQKIAVENPNNITAKRVLASLYLYSKKEVEGVALTEELIAKDKYNYSVWMTAMNYFLYNRYFDTATDYLNRMEIIFPDSTDIFYSKMLISRTEDNNQEALSYALKGLDLSQKQKQQDKEVMFYNSIGELYYDLKKYQESYETYDALLKKYPDDITALNNYAYYLSERGVNLDYALNLSKRTLDQQNGEPNYLDTYGWILYKMKRYEEAKTYIAKAITLAGKNVSAIVLEHYADIEFRLGNKDNAIKLWKAIADTGQGSEFLKKKIKDKTIYE